MATPEYHELHVCDGDRVVAWVFVGPQDLPGASLSTGRLERPEGGSVIYGDLLCGTDRDGAWLIDVEVNVGDGPDGPLLLGTRYDLARGRCFVIRPNYRVEQLPFVTPAEARQHLAAGG
jgi:hypothetical protein